MARIKKWRELKKLTDYFRENEKRSAYYHQRKMLEDGIPEASLNIIHGHRVGRKIQKNKEKFIHTELATDDFTPCFLESEMHLWASELFLDGTFSLTRSTEFSQVYIFSHLFENDNKRFSHPFLWVKSESNGANLVQHNLFLFILMRNKNRLHT